MDSNIRMCDSCKWWKENCDSTQKVCEVCTPDIAGEFPPDDEVIVNYLNDNESGDVHLKTQYHGVMSIKISGYELMHHFMLTQHMDLQR